MLLCERFLDRDDWHERMFRLSLVPGAKIPDEPDWFGVSYRLPVDPAASIEDQLRQWNQLVQPAIDSDIAQQRSRRSVIGKE